MFGTQTPSNELRTPVASTPCSPVDALTHSNAPLRESSSVHTLHVDHHAKQVPFRRMLTAFV